MSLVCLGVMPGRACSIAVCKMTYCSLEFKCPVPLMAALTDEFVYILNELNLWASSCQLGSSLQSERVRCNFEAYSYTEGLVGAGSKCRRQVELLERACSSSLVVSAVVLVCCGDARRFRSCSREQQH